MDTINSLIEQLSALSTAQIGELKGRLEQKWGVTADVFIPAVTVPDAEPVVVQVEFVASLIGFAADKKMSVIREVRELTKLGLLESKTLVEGATPAEPKELKFGLTRAEADEIKNKIESVGGVVEVK